ncbi:MAG: hypothetical protein LUQ40_03735 [Methanomicrobiales archaeon]|nr:hypothetical protein [Methanomicrobiales archaeon]
MRTGLTLGIGVILLALLLVGLFGAPYLAGSRPGKATEKINTSPSPYPTGSEWKWTGTLKELPPLDTTGLEPVERLVIDPAILSATPYWLLVIPTTEEQKVLLGYIDESNITVQEKKEMKNFLQMIWEKYPVQRVKDGLDVYVSLRDGSTELKFSADENKTLEKIFMIVMKGWGEKN